MDGRPWEIIGIMPQRFGFLDRAVDVIDPMRLDPSGVTVGGYFFRSLARLKPGITLEKASQDAARMIPMAVDAFPLRPGTTRHHVENSRLRPNLRPLARDVIGDVGATRWC